VVVIVNEPKGEEHYGGQVAAPVFSRIVSGAMRLLNVPPDNFAAEGETHRGPT
jgi:cell division protein FtsI (penicillin-binding protein 3)